MKNEASKPSLFTLLTSPFLLVALVFVLSAFATSGCAGRTPWEEIICAGAPEEQRCLEEESKK